VAVKTFYAIYDQDLKRFKGRGNQSGVRWTGEPTQTYDTKGRAEGALKAHLKAWSYWNKNKTRNIVIKEVTVSWED